VAARMALEAVNEGRGSSMGEGEFEKVGGVGCGSGGKVRLQAAKVTHHDVGTLAVQVVSGCVEDGLLV